MARQPTGRAAPPNPIEKENPMSRTRKSQRPAAQAYDYLLALLPVLVACVATIVQIVGD